MKARKILGNILTCLGGILLFGGLLAWFLPRWDNSQVQLVINSFHTPSGNLFLQWMNNGMTFAMNNAPTVLILGAVLMMIGILLSSSVRTESAAQAAPAVRQAATAAPVVTAAAVAAAPQVNPFARVQSSGNAESNPFAKYLAPDSVPKRTVQRGEEVQTVAAAAPAAESLPAELPVVAEAVQDPDDTKVYRLTADAEEGFEAEEEPVLFSLIDDEEDDDDDDVLFESATETAPVDASGEYYYPLQPEEEEIFLPLNDDKEEPEAATAELLEEAAEADFAEAVFEPLEPEPATEENAEPQWAEPATEAPADVEAAAEEAAAEQTPAAEETAEEPMPEPMPDPQPAPSLRPVIRSTFKKSTASQSADAHAHRNTVSENAALRPAPRIKSTMGQKR